MNDVASIYRANHRFVWITLARFGVPEQDRWDQSQEVFIVVHRKLCDYRHESALRTWLFGIARRVASAYHRRWHRKVEVLVEAPEPPHATLYDQQDVALARQRLLALYEMSQVHWMTFVLFVVAGMSGREIAGLMDCPLQTVFSRLRRARELVTATSSRSSSPRIDRRRQN